MLRYYVAANFWLFVAILAFVGRKFERSEPEMFSFLGTGRWFYPNEYRILEFALLILSAVFFCLWIWTARDRSLK